MEESDELFAAMARQTVWWFRAPCNHASGVPVTPAAGEEERFGPTPGSGSFHRRTVPRPGLAGRDTGQRRPAPCLQIRILRNLELLDTVGLDVVMLPDALYHHARHIQLCGQYSDAPVRRVGRSSLQSCLQNLLLHFRCECPTGALAFFRFANALDPTLGEGDPGCQNGRSRQAGSLLDRVAVNEGEGSRDQ